MDIKKIPFNKPSITALEEKYVLESLRSGSLSGDGPFTKKCHQWFEKNLQTRKALLTHSCTAALEMASILGELNPGDEVIMPSFTFVSTANAVVLRGAIPVFIEVRPDTLNIDEKKIERAITKKTKAIMVMHYAGVGCEMDTIMALAQNHKLPVFEDAAQCLNAKYKGKALGSIGNLGTISFHETKNIISGEGGVLLINDEKHIKRAEIIREKGTNRSQFFRGEVDKYSWVDMGSSYLPSDLLAALLLAQLERSQEITSARMKLWKKYSQELTELENRGFISMPKIPAHCEHNAHIFYFMVKNLDTRSKLLQHFKNNGIGATFHYVPLHSAIAGKKFARTDGDLKLTDEISDRLVRLPLWMGLEDQDRIISAVVDFFKKT